MQARRSMAFNFFQAATIPHFERYVAKEDASDGPTPIRDGKSRAHAVSVEGNWTPSPVVFRRPIKRKAGGSSVIDDMNDSLRTVPVHTPTTADLPVIPIDVLRQFAYCPRRAVLQWRLFGMARPAEVKLLYLRLDRYKTS